MKCRHCAQDNLLMANYCCACGRPFTEDERKAAYDQTVYGRIDQARKVKDILTLDVVTSSVWFRVLTLVLIVALGIWLRVNGVRTLRLESGEGYRLEYLQAADTYYVIAGQDAVDLRLVVPNRTTALVVEERDESEALLSERTFPTDGALPLEVSGASHYVLRARRGEKDAGALTVFVWRESEAAE